MLDYTTLILIELGKRLENWLSKASTYGTRAHWKSRWLKFARWVTTEENPLTGKKYMDCSVNEVDDYIRKDFEAMPNHLFQDKYRDVLTKYVTSLSHFKSNTALSIISSVRSFFTNETVSIKLQKSKLPRSEMAMGEHRFNLNEFRSMWLVANTEGKARLSVAISLGWGIGDFLSLTTKFIKDVIRNVDDDGFASFDYRRMKTKARIRGILPPTAIQDLEDYLKKFPENQEYLWTTKTKESFSYWLRSLCKEAGIDENGTIRFHLIRKYTFDMVSSQCGVYEAKLLVGKRIPLSDATYLHNLEDRLLERYKKFAYPFLQLNGTIKSQEGKLEQLTDRVESLTIEVEAWKKMAIKMKKEKRESLERIERIEDVVKILRKTVENL